MRAGPLSDRRVIDVLNQSFVSIYVANEDYLGSEGLASAEERKELQRIRHEGRLKQLPGGAVRVWVLTPDGHTHDVLQVGGAARTAGLLAMLERAIQRFNPKPGKPVVPPEPQVIPPAAPPDAVILHLVSRGDDRGSWGQFPAENLIVLTRERWEKLLPSGDVTPGQTWELDRDVSARILTYFYPQTENNDARMDRIQQHALTAKVLTLKDGLVTARIDGFLRMQHVFYPGRKDAQPLGAEVVGVLTFAPGRAPSIQLATTKAQHGRRPFSVAVWTLPRAAP
jgi:hypothetical protein